MVEIYCVDCGKGYEIPESFFEGGAGPFWKLHGHYPALTLLRCSCGAERAGGPMVHSNTAQGGKNAALLDSTFYQEHQKCR